MAPKWFFNILTLFPDTCRGFLNEGVVGQALKHGLLDAQLVNPRDFSTDAYRRVDDRPFGGGDGMLMMVEPLARALDSISMERRGRVVLLSPQGRKWTDALARTWAAEAQPVTFVCGRYAGVDERFRQLHVDEEISLGDFVLSGGELGALAIIDAVARFIPGVLGNEESALRESFADGLLECPQFTRPREYRGAEVPEVLLGGNHQLIQNLRQAVSLLRTYTRRPELLSPEQLREIPERARALLELKTLELKSFDLEEQQLQRWAKGDLS